MKMRKYMLKTLTVPDTTDLQKLYHGWHGLGKGTKMLKCLLPQQGLRGSLNGPFYPWEYYMAAEQLSFILLQGDRDRSNGARQILGHWPTMALIAS